MFEKMFGWVFLNKVLGILGISNGGTGASSASGARQNLEVYSKDEVDSAISSAAGNPREVSFVNQTSVTVIHNLGFKPKGITVLNSDGNQIIVPIMHINTSTFVMSSDVSFSGKIIY